MNSSKLASTTAGSLELSTSHPSIYVAKPNETAKALTLSSDNLNLDSLGFTPSPSKPIISTISENALSTHFLWLLPSSDMDACQEGIAFVVIPYDSISPSNQELPVCHLRQRNGCPELKKTLDEALDASDTPPFLKEALKIHTSKSPTILPPFQIPITNIKTRDNAPVLTEFALFAGIAGNKEELQTTQLNQPIPIYLTLYSLIEIWNPSGLKLLHEPNVQEFNITLTGLSSISGLPIQLPETLSFDYDLWTSLQAGAVQMLASPSTNGGSIHTGVWQFYLGDALLRSFYPSLEIQFNKILIELKMKSQDGWITLHQMSLEDLLPIRRNYSSQTPFLRNLSSNGKQGMGRLSLQRSDYSWSIHYKMNDSWFENEGLPYWLRTQDFRKISHHLSYHNTGTNPYWELSPSSSYNKIDSFSKEDFFVYDPYDKRNRRYARIYDPICQRPQNYYQLRSSFSPDFQWQALGESYGGILNEIFDRYTFDMDSSTENLSELERAYSFHGLNLNRPESYIQIDRTHKDTVSLHFYDTNSNLFCTQNLQLPLFNHPESYSYNWYPRYVDPIGENDLQAEKLDDLYDDWQHPWAYQSHRDLAEFSSLERCLQNEFSQSPTIFHSAKDFIHSGKLERAIESCNDPIPAHLPAGLSQGEFLSYLDKEYQVTDDMILCFLYYERSLKEDPEQKSIYRAQCLFIRTLNADQRFQWLPIQFTDKGIQKQHP